MQFSIFLAGASLVAAALAANTIAFTQVPANVTAGVPTTVKWAGGDASSAVTITLKEGDPHDLKSVAILAGDATGGSYTWTPSKSLPNADDYALQITQGENLINYSGQFPLTGGSDSSATPASTSASATNSSAIATATAVVVASSNATMTTTLAPSASGTGISVPRNTTFVSQTLTASQSGGLVVGAPTTTAAASVTSPAAATTTTSASAAGKFGSSLALVLCAVAAMMFWS